MTAMTDLKPKLAGRKYAGQSPEKRKIQRREQFLEAGLEVFGTIGFRAATVRYLCKQAKLTDRYFYESFGSLEKLLLAVYEHCMTELTRKILSAITTSYSDHDAPKAMEAGLDAFFSALEEPRVARICMVELEGINSEVDRLYNSYIHGFSSILLELARQAFPHWNLDRKTQEVIGISLVGAMRQSATNWLMTDYATDRRTVVEGTRMLFIGIIKLMNEQESLA